MNSQENMGQASFGPGGYGGGPPGGGYGGPPGGGGFGPPGGGGYGGPPGGGGYGGPPPGGGGYGGPPPGGYGPPPGGPPGFGPDPGFGGPPMGPGFGQEPSQGLAIAALVCGILSILGTCCYGGNLLPGIAAIVCGIMAMNRNKAMPQQYGGRGMALAGLICGIAGSVFGLLYLIFVVLLGVAGAFAPH